MRRRLILLAGAAAALAACSPPSSNQSAEPPAAPPPPVAEAACNALVPDLTKPVRLGAEVVAVASLPPELPGGPITPGTYDLTAGHVAGGAPEWNEERFVALDVSESDAGVTFNYAEARQGAETERWTATFHQGPPSQVQVTCGPVLTTVGVEYAAGPNELRLRVPDSSGTGQRVLLFTKRG